MRCAAPGCFGLRAKTPSAMRPARSRMGSDWSPRGIVASSASAWNTCASSSPGSAAASVPIAAAKALRAFGASPGPPQCLDGAQIATLALGGRAGQPRGRCRRQPGERGSPLLRLLEEPQRLTEGHGLAPVGQGKSGIDLLRRHGTPRSRLRSRSCGATRRRAGSRPAPQRRRCWETPGPRGALRAGQDRPRPLARRASPTRRARPARRLRTPKRTQRRTRRRRIGSRSSRRS